MSPTDAELLELGRALHKELCAPRAEKFPRTIQFEIFDHKRCIAAYSMHRIDDHDALFSVKFRSTVM